jgi:hypothetical protein
MSWLRSLTICCCLLLLIPARANAAPLPQTMICDIGSWFSQLPFHISYIPHVQEKQVVIDGDTLTLRICAPQEHEIEADDLLTVMQKALPQLDDRTDLPLSGSAYRPLMIAPDDTHIPSVDDGIDRDGIIYLDHTISDIAMVYEGARYWANDRNFSELWLRAGYSKYLTDLVTRKRNPSVLADGRCDGIALLNWQPEAPATRICGYAGGAEIFHKLTETLGEDKLREALGQLRAESGPIDSWGLLIGLERISGRSLTSIFRERVFPPALNPQLDQRDALRRRIERATVMAKQSGIKLPASVGEAFNSDAVAGATSLLDRLEPSLELIGAIEGTCGRLTLSCDRYWQPLPETTSDLAALLTRLRASKALLDQYVLLDDNAQALGLKPPAQLAQRVAIFRPAAGDLRHAHDQLMGGIGLEQRCVTQNLACAQWRDLWQKNQVAAVDSILQKSTTMLDDAPALEQFCSGTGWACDSAWRAVFERSGDPQRTIDFMADAHAAMHELTLAAANMGAPSGVGRKLLAPILGADAATLLDSARQAFAAGDLDGARALVQAARTAQQTDASQGAWLPWAIAALLIGLVVLLAGVALRRKRRPARVQHGHDQLLATLLAQPPSKDGRKQDDKTKKAA